MSGTAQSQRGLANPRNQPLTNLSFTRKASLFQFIVNSSFFHPSRSTAGCDGSAGAAPIP